jgi:hypothetical protein
MYFHAPAKNAPGQRTFVALSRDGLTFTPSDQPLGSFYFRAFRWRGRWYAIAKGGELWRSNDGLTPFEVGPTPLSQLPRQGGRGDSVAERSIRHVAVRLAGDSLFVYYTCVGDSPERIFRTTLPLQGDWTTWRPPTPPVEVLRPEAGYEGAELPARPSRPGPAAARENALRDPAVYVEQGRTYLIYSIAGEAGLAIAELGPP